jgi:hypothetical protein
MVRKSIQKYNMVSASWFYNYNRLQRTVNITLCLRVEDEILSINGKIQKNKATAAQTAFVQKSLCTQKLLAGSFLTIHLTLDKSPLLPQVFLVMRVTCT